MKKILLFYPPSKLYQRGEERSQGNIEDSTATSIRAANDLGYGASSLSEKGFEVLLKDYQTERLEYNDLENDFLNFKPDVIFLSITNATIFKDIEVVNHLLARRKDVVVILKGALFYSAEEDLLEKLDLDNVNYLLGGESDFILAELVNSHFNDNSNIKNLRGILYKQGNKWVKTDFTTWDSDIDSLIPPDRSRMNNSLYIRPDTGEKQATIITSRGCPSKCVFCLTPTISGTKLRLRSPENIHDEILECYEKHDIHNFFFRSDTFTIDRRWVDKLCTLIIKSNLQNKIEWVANSRVKPLQDETLFTMKEAGCWLIAFGYESGSPETLIKIKKGCTVEDNIRAGELAKKAKLKSFGFFLVGLPWENNSHLEETKNLIFQLDSDFIEIHLAVPYYGTPLYELAKKEGLIDDTVLGKDYFNSPTTGTKFLSMSDIEEYKRKMILDYHLRPKYILNKLTEVATKPKVLKNYMLYGSKLLIHNFRSKKRYSTESY